MQKTHRHAIISLETDLLGIEAEIKSIIDPIPEYSRKYRRLKEAEKQFKSAIRILNMVDKEVISEE